VEATRSGGSDPYAQFFKDFKASELCFLPCAARAEPAALHRALVDGLLSFGQIGIAEGVGAAMHLYMLTAFATMPLSEADLMHRRDVFLAMVLKCRFLIANTGSDAQTRSANAGRSATDAVRVPGGSVINGAKSFVSLVEVADVILFTAKSDTGRPVFFVSPMADPAIRVGAPHFDSAFPMHTCSVEFHDLFVPDNMAFPESASSDVSSHVHIFQRALFQSLIPAVYLGAATRAMKEAAIFAKAARLSELDGVHAELGRSVIHLQGALAATRVCNGAFENFVRQPSALHLQAFVEAAAVAKHVGCGVAAEIVTKVQRFIGTRALEPGHAMAEIARLAPFGPLHPVVGAQAERQFGRALLQAAA
jgi:alkylation response protein AidB-like acyl-CoA dehydrogenase